MVPGSNDPAILVGVCGFCGTGYTEFYVEEKISDAQCDIADFLGKLLDIVPREADLKGILHLLKNDIEMGNELVLTIYLEKYPPK
jgi:hypothetical protein